MRSIRSIIRACKKHEINDTLQSSTVLYVFDFLYISKDLAFRIEASSIVRSDEWSCCRLARISTKDMIGHHFDG